MSHFALSWPRLASAVTHIDANVTEHTQKADIHLCLQPRSSRGRWGEEEEEGWGGWGEGVDVHLKHDHFHHFHWTKKKLPAQ